MSCLASTGEVAGAQALATLLQLGRRARQANSRSELCFIAVNETHALAPYRQAALWLEGRGVAGLSGVVSVEGNAPYVHWLGGVFRHLARSAPGSEPRSLTAADLAEADARDWGNWLPAHGLWLPLPAMGRRFAGGALLLARDWPWTEAELAFLSEWAAIWAHACDAQDRGALGRLRLALGGSEQRSAFRWLLRPRMWALAGMAGLLAFPVELTVLAPAEVIPLNPAVIRAPLDGVIDRLAVAPNQRVEADEILFEFDRTNVRNRLLVAERALETARTEYRLRAQKALSESESTAQLAVIQGQVAEKSLEIEFLRELDSRSTVVAPRDGIVLFDDPTGWIGRPVVTGERVMVVADEGAVEIEAWLSPANAIPLADGSEVTVYLNSDPLRPLAAHLHYLAHEATARPEGHYAYRVRASLAGDDAGARAGLKGTAKLSGGTVPLAYWIMRRPLADLRSWLGA